MPSFSRRGPTRACRHKGGEGQGWPFGGPDSHGQILPGALLPAPGSLRPSQPPTREVWKQGTFYSTGNANVLSNEEATRKKQPLIFACLRWDGAHPSCFLQRPLHLVVPGQWSAAWNRHHAHPARAHRQSGCIMLSRRASRRYSGSLGVVKVSMGGSIPTLILWDGHAPGRRVGHVHENSGVLHKHVRCWGLAVASVGRGSFSGHTWKAQPCSAPVPEHPALLEVGFLCV